MAGSPPWKWSHLVREQQSTVWKDREGRGNESTSPTAKRTLWGKRGVGEAGSPTEPGDEESDGEEEGGQEEEEEEEAKEEAE